MAYHNGIDNQHMATVNHLSSSVASTDQGFRRARVDLSDQVISHKCIALLYYWRSICDGRAMPKWTDLDLMSLPSLAPFLIVKDVETGSGHNDPGAIYRNRFWGTGIVSALGFDGSRMALKDYNIDQRGHDAMTRIYDMVVDTISPVRSVGYIEFVKDRDHVGYESLFLPLAGKVDNQIAHVIAAYDFQYDPETEGLSPVIGLV